MSDFLEQFKANCRKSVRRTPFRLLRLVFVFVVAIVLAPICTFVANVAGDARVAMVVGIAGVVGALAVWWLVERAIENRVEGPARADRFESPPIAGAVQVPCATRSPLPPEQAEVVPELVRSDNLAWNAPEPGSAGGGCSGCAIALVVAGGVMFLSCCGGGIALWMLGSRVADHANGRIVVQEDPFFEQQRQARHIDDLVRRQQERLRKLDRQPFGPDPTWYSPPSDFGRP